MKIPHQAARRPGAIAPMAAMKLVFLIMLVALAVDISWIALASMELQNAADAAALAGTDKLMENYILYHMPKQSESQKTYLLNQGMANARNVAKEFAAKNGAGGVSSLVLLDQDIEFGFMNEKYEYTPMPTYEGYPNTCRVQIRRDSIANTSLKLFFAQVPQSPQNNGSPILFASTLPLATTIPFTGMRIDLNRSAAASLNGSVINNFYAQGAPLAVLPMALDEVIWDAYLTKGVDPYGNTPRTDELGNPALEIYSNYSAKGNFGELSLDGRHSGASESTNWIDFGLRASDVESLQELKLLPLSDKSTWNWLGNPGFKASTVMAVNNYASTLQAISYNSGHLEQRYFGKVFLLPLFKAKDGSSDNYQAGVGQGSSYYYNITRFVGVRIMPTAQSNREILVQPAPYVDIRDYFQSIAKPIAPPPENTPVVTTFSTSTFTR